MLHSLSLNLIFDDTELKLNPEISETDHHQQQENNIYI